MSLRRRLEKLRDKTGRCDCEPVYRVMYTNPPDRPPDARPAPELCPLCGRQLVVVIEVRYIEPAPAEWLRAEHGGIGKAELMRRWQTHLESLERQGPAALPG